MLSNVLKLIRASKTQRACNHSFVLDEFSYHEEKTYGKSGGPGCVGKDTIFNIVAVCPACNKKIKSKSIDSIITGYSIPEMYEISVIEWRAAGGGEQIRSGKNYDFWFSAVQENRAFKVKGICPKVRTLHSDIAARGYLSAESCMELARLDRLAHPTGTK